MATTESLSCRICCSFLSSSHCIAVFPDPKRYSSDLAKRLSRVIEVPITPKDGLSQHICRPCNRKFLSAESFRVLAKASYEKSRAPLPRPLTGVTGSPTSTRVVAPRKRSKDTSGVGVSPHTHLARPSAKRQTVGATGRRLCFPVQDNSKIKINRFQKFILYFASHCSKRTRRAAEATEQRYTRNFCSDFSRNCHNSATQWYMYTCRVLQ